MSTLLTVRQDLADHLTADLTGITVYAYPADVVVLPALVIIPADPWWEVVGFKANEPRLRVNLDIQILVKRAEPKSFMAEIETLGLAIALSIVTADQPFKFVSLAEPEQVNIGEVEAVVSTFSLFTHL